MAMGRWECSALLHSQFSDIKCSPSLTFCGETDGGLTFPGAQQPFAIIEVGVSDTQRKKNSRTEHRLRKAGRQVPTFCQS